MSLLSKLFSIFKSAPEPALPVRPVKNKPLSSVSCNTHLNSNFIDVKNPSFYGLAHFSPNKQWVVGLNDSDGESSGGARDSGNGKICLVDYKNDLVKAILTKVARPFDVAVSDVGIFVIHDCGFGGGLNADIITYSFEGVELYRFKTDANVFSIGVSACGRFLALQTCHAKGNKDDNVFQVHDTVQRQKMFSVTPATDWSREYSFEILDGRLKKVWVSLPKLGRFTYDLAGHFLDARKYLHARLNKGDTGSRILAAQELLASNPSQADAEKILKVTDEVLALGANDWSAKAHRVRGETFEVLGQTSEAILAYETALSLNPKIGVKKKLTALQKVATWV